MRETFYLLPLIGLLFFSPPRMLAAVVGQDQEDRQAQNKGEQPVTASENTEEKSEPEKEQPPRERYNDSFFFLNEKRFDKAEKGFLAARDLAGGDVELRYRAAYNLGMTYASIADTHGEALEKTIDSLRSSAAWFRDAIRIREEDNDARINLELILRRIQQLADQVNQGKNGLAAHLDRLIEDERALREDIRNLMAKIDAAEESAEPIAFEETFNAIASQQRTLLSDADTVSFMAGEEIGNIESMPDDEKKETDQLRKVQLESMLLYLDRGRERLADTRVFLRKLRGDKAHQRSSQSIDALKRAKEQLLGPGELLKRFLQDQTKLLFQTEETHRSSVISAGNSIAAESNQAGRFPAIPGWLKSDYLADRQSDIASRSMELKHRISAGLAQQEKITPEEREPSAENEAKMENQLAVFKQALPLLETGISEMGMSKNALEGQDFFTAIGHEQKAVKALSSALEQFSDLKTLIDLTHQEQDRLVALLSDDKKNKETLSESDQKQIVLKSGRRNQRRLERMADLIQEAVSKQQHGSDSPSGQTTPAPPSQEDEERTAQEMKRYDLAEQYRSKALGSLNAAITLAKGDENGIFRIKKSSNQTLQNVHELQKLFFTLIEHLKQLIRDQGETLDQTASVAREVGNSDKALSQALSPFVPLQEQHAAIAEEIAKTLKQQAEEKTAQANENPEQTGPDFAEASKEVFAANEKMSDARSSMLIEKPEMKDILDQQKTAVEHLLKALQLLNPQQNPNPDQNQQNNEQNQGDDAQEAQQKDENQNQKLSRSQAERRLQAIRERESQRRQKKNRQMMANEAVEKDW